jgi:hypothetical protein
MMYESFTEAYQETAPKNGGPQIPVLGDDPEEYAARYQKKLQTGIQATLKNKNATAATYSDEQKAAMIWYNYLFLGRGKPSTHITAMAKLTPPELKANAPAVLLRMFDRIEAIINQG